MGELEQQCLQVINLCCLLEQMACPVAFKERLAAAWARSLEKAFVVGWYKEVDPHDANPAVIRAAERGAREFFRRA